MASKRDLFVGGGFLAATLLLIGFVYFQNWSYHRTVAPEEVAKEETLAQKNLSAPRGSFLVGQKRLALVVDDRSQKLRNGRLQVIYEVGGEEDELIMDGYMMHRRPYRAVCPSDPEWESLARKFLGASPERLP